MTLACLSSQSCTELGPAQPQLVYLRLDLGLVVGHYPHPKQLFRDVFQVLMQHRRHGTRSAGLALSGASVVSDLRPSVGCWAEQQSISMS